MTDLGALGAATNTSNAKGINNAGQVVGSSGTDAGATHAFLYSGGVMTDLGTLPGGTNSFATSINNSGLVVGYSEATAAPPLSTDAFLYTGTTLIDLNSLIPAALHWHLTQANGINDRGDIVGYGEINGGPTRAFLLTNVVPEPSSLILLTLTTSAVALSAWRRRKKSAD
jgi:probable HAF family extracellular repeat protein